jgi:eukaryotic-like serine/threonine-protein kinase
MKKSELYRQDWFIALIIGLVFSIAMLTRSGFLERAELIAYDLGVKATHRLPGAAEQIVIVAIDDQTIKDIGRWPLPRNALADVLERLAKAEARAVGLLVDLTEPQIDPGLTSLREIRDKLENLEARAPLGDVRALLDQAAKELDTDGSLAQALAKTPRLHLPLAVPTDGTAAAAPDYIQGYRLSRVIAASDHADQPPRVARVTPALEAFVRHAAAMGHQTFRFDSDRGVRTLQAALEHDGHYYAAMPLLLAASSMNLDVRHMELELGKGITLGKLFVPVDRDARTYTGFYLPPPGAAHPFSVYSLRDVRNDKLAPALFTNKIVLIGLTADSLGAKFLTPLTNNASMSEPELTAHMAAAILNQDFYTVPPWSGWAETGMVLALMLYLMFVLPRINSKIAALITLLLLVGLLVAAQFLMVSEKLWLRTVAPAMLLFAGHLALVGKRFLLGERDRLAAQTDSAHNNRLLGLAFQAQGQLDMAMDKFRKLSVDESVLELIYSVARDFERKRQFHKAAAAYDHILSHDSGFRDSAERKKRATQADQSGMLGTVVLDGTEKPTLGRYLVEKEIGRGAMGAVYLGRDPKINRLVAIKTLSLSNDFDAKDLASIRERFFREAETAGRLHHPNIVTIYDVGEEHDLAYIAMEYLEGKDLSTYLEPDKPLPFDWVLDVAIKVADALTYAHDHDVVHRDIKPHNIIYHEATRGVKVTDFGIARISAASHTKTGIVLGTPSYMSPEQISGKRVDGRSDLFSFGAMLYEMITGQTPFPGDSLATLTYQITNGPTPDIRKLRADTPPALVGIIKRLLQKPVGKRYQSAEELREDLEECRDTLPATVKA